MLGPAKASELFVTLGPKDGRGRNPLPLRQRSGRPRACLARRLRRTAGLQLQHRHRHVRRQLGSVAASARSSTPATSIWTGRCAGRSGRGRARAGARSSGSRTAWTDVMTTGADAILRRLVDSIVSAGCVITLVATLGVMAWPRVTHALGIKPRPPPMPYLAGRPHRHTGRLVRVRAPDAVVFARASCGACRKASAVLSSSWSSSSPAARRSWWLAAPTLAIRTREFARLMGVSDTGFKLAPAGLRVRATPTLVLVDRQGRILAAWEGVGPPEKQNAIAKIIDERLIRQRCD